MYPCHWQDYNQKLPLPFHDVSQKLVAGRTTRETVMNSCYYLAHESRFVINPKQAHTTHHSELIVIHESNPPSQQLVDFTLRCPKPVSGCFQAPSPEVIATTIGSAKHRCSTLAVGDLSFKWMGPNVEVGVCLVCRGGKVVGSSLLALFHCACASVPVLAQYPG